MPLPNSLPAVIRNFGIRAQEEVYTALPGVVRRFDPETLEVDVELAVKLARRSEDGSPVYFACPVIPNVRVSYNRGGGFISTYPLQDGDCVTLIVSTLDVGQWELSGEVPSEPLNLCRQNLTSCVAFPGWFPDSQPPSSVDASARATGMVMGKDGGTNIQVTQDDKVLLGGTSAVPADDYVVTASKLKQVLNTLFTSWVPVPNDGGAALKAKWTGTIAPTFAEDVAASKVLAK